MPRKRINITVDPALHNSIVATTKLMHSFEARGDLSTIVNGLLAYLDMMPSQRRREVIARLIEAGRYCSPYDRRPLEIGYIAPEEDHTD